MSEDKCFYCGATVANPCTAAWQTVSCEHPGWRKREEKINHPPHYGGSASPYEAIKVIEAWELNFNLGNAVKYLCRLGKKDKDFAVVDLEKAIWYLNRELGRMKRTSSLSPGSGSGGARVRSDVYSSEAEIPLLGEPEGSIPPGPLVPRRSPTFLELMREELEGNLITIQGWDKPVGTFRIANLRENIDGNLNSHFILTLTTSP